MEEEEDRPKMTPEELLKKFMSAVGGQQEETQPEEHIEFINVKGEGPPCNNPADVHVILEEATLELLQLVGKIKRASVNLSTMYDPKMKPTISPEKKQNTKPTKKHNQVSLMNKDNQLTLMKEILDSLDRLRKSMGID